MTQRVLISGGASGLGRELARAYAERGAKVAIADIHAERLAEVQAELGAPHLALELDVTDPAQWQTAVARVCAEFGGLDLLVNNAGIATGGPVEQESAQAWRRILDINLLGVVYGCQAALAALRESRGAILNVASMAGLIHPPMMGSYNAAKAAVVAYSETLLFELADDGIAVHVLCPGFFRTNLHESLPPESDAMRAVLERIFDRAKLSAADVARAAVAGVDSGQHLILSHPEGRAAHRIKRLFPSTLYRKLMRKQTAGLVRAWSRPA